MIQLLLSIIYLAFISLGLPDGLLGAAWPAIYPELSVPVSYAGGVSMIIACGTVLSSLNSHRLTLRFGTGKVTAFSVTMTAAALFGFSISSSYPALCLWAIPYGLGAGSVDASLNHYVALHYESRHMSWLHCMWGVGASLGPYIMGFALEGGLGWNNGYRIVSLLQVVLTTVLIFSLPLWKSSRSSAEAGEAASKPLALHEIIRIPGAKEAMISFFCYCAIEQTSGLWAASYLHLYRAIPAEAAASFGGLFFLGITAGRAISGFVTMKLNDDQMIRLGYGIIAAGIAALTLPGPSWLALGGFLLIGLGCAPVYPCMIHSAPDRFGPEKSQAIIGVQMASANAGICLMPPLFGIIAERLHIALLPLYLLLLLLLMSLMFHRLCRKM